MTPPLFDVLETLGVARVAVLVVVVAITLALGFGFARAALSQIGHVRATFEEGTR